LEFHTLVSLATSWAMVSLFVHVTVVPTGTLIGFGAKPAAPEVLLAPAGIETATPPDVVGDGAVVLFVLPHAVTEINRDLIIRLALAQRMPSIFAFEAHAHAGALVTYGIDRADAILRTADYVNRILRGARPADLPVQAAERFELLVNLKTAAALGLTIPPTLLARADRVIE